VPTPIATSSRPLRRGRSNEVLNVFGPAPADGTTLAGKLGCITRPGGVMQATYNGYPLYTFGSDSAPGMTNGNGSGGAWHVIRAKAPAATAAPGPGY
jgi:hypothetical protein